MTMYEVLSWVLRVLMAVAPLLLLSLLPPCQGIPGSYINQTFVNPNPDEPFLHMIVDTEQGHGLGSGRVYVGAVNHLFQLSAELLLIEAVKVGPVKDSEKCPPSGQCDTSTKVDTDNYVKAMAIYKRNGKLIVCGSVKQGSCRMHHLYNVSIMDDPVPQAVVANDHVSSSVVFVGPGKDGTQVLYVGSTYTKPGTYREDVPAVATLKLDPPSEMFSYVYKGVHAASYIQVEVTKRELHKITYVTGFTSKKFTYFLTQQPEQENRDPGDLHGYQVKSSKIIRICQEDTKYYSYTEVPLKCTSKDMISGRSNVDYNLLQAAYKTTPGYNLAQSMGLTTDDEVLFAVFQHGNDVRHGDRQSTYSHLSSALCVYSMKQIEQIFLDNIKTCAEGGTYRGLDFIKKGQACQKMQFLTDDQAACGTEVNYPLGGRIPVESEPALTFDGVVATSVLATTVHPHTVVFVGTSDGELRKAMVTRQMEGKEYGTIAVSSSQQPILQDMNFDMSSKFLYALTGPALFKVGVNRCSEYLGCTACLRASDPYCGWCSHENRCSEKDNCDKEQWLSFEDRECTAITKINPDKLPINKADYLKITVQNFPDVKDLMCVFKFPGTPEPVTIGATRHDKTEIACANPNRMPPIPAGKHHMESTLSIAANKDGTPFASANFTFFDCASFASCTSCVSSDFPCDWCPRSAKCTHKAEETCVGEKLVTGINHSGPSLRNGSQYCPALASNEPEILVPAGTRKAISVKVLNVKDFDDAFKCLFDIGPSQFSKPAQLLGDTLTCAEMDFNYFSREPNVTAKFTVMSASNKTLDNEIDVRVLIYKCEDSASNCGECFLLPDKLECGWCRAQLAGRCLRKSTCASAVWLDRSEVCPNPKILSFSPVSGPIEGGTRVLIEGENLGKSADDVTDSIKINNFPCKVIPEEYEPSRKIVCITSHAQHNKTHSGPVYFQTKQDKEFVSHSDSSFYYVNPTITGFSPLRGPTAGGTTVTVSGTNLDAGSSVGMVVSGVECTVLEPRTYDSIRCVTGPVPNPIDGGGIEMHIDKAQRIFVGKQFAYLKDPTLVHIRKDKFRSTASGGIEKTLDGSGLSMIQHPRIFIRLNNKKDFFENCSIKSDTRMVCQTPNINATIQRHISPKLPLEMEYGYQLDGVAIRSPYTIPIYPDPEFYEFERTSGQPTKLYIKDLTIHGKNINYAATEQDIAIFIGRERCNLTALASTALTCKPPEKEPKSVDPNSDFPEVVVIVGGNKSTSDGGNRKYLIGFLSYRNENPPFLTIIAICVACGLFLVALMVVLFAYRRKSTRHTRQMKHLQDQMVNIELKVATECKEAFAELQTDITELTADITGNGIPFLNYSDYALRILFPTSPQELASPPITHDMEKGLRMLNQLIGNKTFLLCAIRTMEASRYFLSKDRVYVGSLLMVILQEKMEYCTDILKTLLAELIERTVERRMQPRILFRRSESVAERLLGAWFSFLMHRYLLDCAGHPLFMLYYAMKQQVEKGPQDAVTHEARYSLSEQKLIRQRIEHVAMTVFVLGLENTPEIPVRVNDVDTVSQVKEKCLDAIYKTTPFSQRPSASDLDLEWHSGGSGRLVLQDVDMTTKSEHSEWKKLNTLAHYKITNNSTLALVAKQSSVFNLSQFSEPSDKSFRSLSTFSLKNSPTLNRALSPSSTPLHHKDPEAGFKVYHLVKPQEHTDATQPLERPKMVSEIYLTRLLTTKGTLQKFVEDLFETIFSTAHRQTALPNCIKYMFDFLDDQAIQHGIYDNETVHVWKSNSLPLRFWVNLIKNPHFVFDIQKPTKIEGCLSVVAQTLMDSCSTQDHQLTKDSPSSKLLFARDIPNYREWVDRYYRDIKRLPAVSDQDMNAFLADESRQHQQEFPITPALFHFHRYVAQYKDTMLQNLELDEFSKRNKLPHKFLQYLKFAGEEMIPGVAPGIV